MKAPISTPAADRRGYRRALGAFGTGVAVVTIEGQDRPLGITINSFVPVSMDPPLVLWTIGERAATATVFCDAERFAVHLLAAGQREVAERFAMSPAQPREGIDWSIDSTGLPRISACIARFTCTRHAIHPGGDHRIIVGEVQDFHYLGGQALLFVDGMYTELVLRPGD